MGFTLIELLIALSIFAFLVMLAGPMFADLMANSRIRTAAESSLDGVRLAQQEAIKENIPAQFLLTPAVGWQVQYTDETNPTGPFLVLQSYNFSEGATGVSVTAHPGGASQVTFNGLGRVVPNLDGSASLSWIELKNPAATGSRPLNTVIHAVDAAGTTFTGIKLCDPDPGVAVSDPRHCPVLIP